MIQINCVHTSNQVDPDQVDPHQVAFTLWTKLIQINLICIRLNRIKFVFTLLLRSHCSNVNLVRINLIWINLIWIKLIQVSPYNECNLMWIILIPSRKHAYIILTPLNPTFYIVKLGFTGVYIIFLISSQNIDCGYPQSMFWAEIRKISEFFIWKFSVFGREVFYILE